MVEPLNLNINGVYIYMDSECTNIRYYGKCFGIMHQSIANAAQIG